MKKEIKFRAILNRKAQTRQQYSGLESAVYFTLEDLMRRKVNFSYPEHWYFSQYTGLDDKNGKEIYEDDTLKAERSYWDVPRILIVEWFGERYGLRNPKDSVDSEVMDKESCFNVPESEREIIGNIYENPELLSSSEDES